MNKKYLVLDLTNGNNGQGYSSPIIKLFGTLENSTEEFYRTIGENVMNGLISQEYGWEEDGTHFCLFKDDPEETTDNYATILKDVKSGDIYRINTNFVMENDLIENQTIEQAIEDIPHDSDGMKTKFNDSTYSVTHVTDEEDGTLYILIQIK